MRQGPFTTRVILDASATIRILTDPESAGHLKATISAATQVMAPALMLTEVANVLWKIERAGQLGGTDPLDLLHDAAALVDHVEPDATLLAEAPWRRTSTIPFTTASTWCWRAVKWRPW